MPTWSPVVEDEVPCAVPPAELAGAGPEPLAGAAVAPFEDDPFSESPIFLSVVVKVVATAWMSESRESMDVSSLPRWIRQLLAKLSRTAARCRWPTAAATS